MMDLGICFVWSEKEILADIIEVTYIFINISLVLWKLVIYICWKLFLHKYTYWWNNEREK